MIQIKQQVVAFKQASQKTLIYYNANYFFEVVFKHGHLYKFWFYFDGVSFHLFFIFYFFIFIFLFFIFSYPHL